MALAHRRSAPFSMSIFLKDMRGEFNSLKANNHLLDATSGFQQSVWRACVAKLRAESDPARERINAKTLIRCSCALDTGIKVYMSRRFSRATGNGEIFCD
jgi:hypothetical protein